MGFERIIKQHREGNVASLCATRAGMVDRALIERITRSLIAERRKRSDHFPSELFSDPAWDILLILTLAEARCQRLTVSQVYTRVPAPPTTALRWIQAMTEQGYLVRLPDTTDRRRKYIELSPEVYAKMVSYCSTVGAAYLLAA